VWDKARKQKNKNRRREGAVFGIGTILKFNFDLGDELLDCRQLTPNKMPNASPPALPIGKQ